jgi:hypothetical protein
MPHSRNDKEFSVSAFSRAGRPRYTSIGSYCYVMLERSMTEAIHLSRSSLIGLASGASPKQYGSRSSHSKLVAYSWHASSNALRAPSHAPRCFRCFRHQVRVDPLWRLSRNTSLLRSPTGSSRCVCPLNHPENVIIHLTVELEFSTNNENLSVIYAQRDCDDFRSCSN